MTTRMGQSIHTHIYTNSTHKYTYNTHIHTYIPRDIHTNPYTYLHIYIRSGSNVSRRGWGSLYIPIYKQIYTYTYIHTHIHTNIPIYIHSYIKELV